MERSTLPTAQLHTIWPVELVSGTYAAVSDGPSVMNASISTVTGLPHAPSAAFFASTSIVCLDEVRATVICVSSSAETSAAVHVVPPSSEYCALPVPTSASVSHSTVAVAFTPLLADEALTASAILSESNVHEPKES